MKAPGFDAAVKQLFEAAEQWANNGWCAQPPGRERRRYRTRQPGRTPGCECDWCLCVEAVSAYLAVTKGARP